MEEFARTPDMDYFDDDELYPVRRITTGAIGDPGQRVFLLQAQVEGETVTWVIEKKQLMTLGKTIPRLLARVREEYPELSEPLVAATPNLALREPLDPVFRVGDVSVDYDRLHDLVVINLIDADADLEDLNLEETEEVEEDGEQVPDLQIFTTRGQALLLGQQADEVISAGRPSCPNCGAPIDDFGHFCLPESVRWRSNSDYWQ